MKFIEISDTNKQEVANVMMSAFNFVNQGWTIEASIKYIEESLKSDLKLALEINGEVVGFIIGNNKSDELFIDAIAVHPDHMRNGYAKLIWNQAVKYCGENSLPGIKLISEPDSLAYNWYKRLGLEETGWVELDIKI